VETSDKTESILRAVEFLQRGELVSFPTETVYGLGCDAGNAQALEKLYKAKGRPENHPVIVHICDPQQMYQWAKDIPQSALTLAQAFWPGPLTLILKRADHVLDRVTGGQPTIGLRLPRHPLAQELLRLFNQGVAAPSANKFGRLSPTCAEDVRKEFGREIALVLDGGICQVGIESTIVDLSGQHPRILRPGMTDVNQLSQVLSMPVTDCQEEHSQVRVPGALPSHYAPSTPLHLVQGGNLQAVFQERLTAKKQFCVLSFQSPPTNEKIAWITASPDPAEYARDLYRNLRQLDDLSLEEIIVEDPPAQPLWAGIRDRLMRASGKG